MGNRGSIENKTQISYKQVIYEVLDSLIIEELFVLDKEIADKLKITYVVNEDDINDFMLKSKTLSLTIDNMTKFKYLSVNTLHDYKKIVKNNIESQVDNYYLINYVTCLLSKITINTKDIFNKYVSRKIEEMTKLNSDATKDIEAQLQKEKTKKNICEEKQFQEPKNTSTFIQTSDISTSDIPAMSTN